MMLRRITIFDDYEIEDMRNGMVVIEKDMDGVGHLYMSKSTYNKSVNEPDMDLEDEDRSFLEDFIHMINDATDAQRMYAVEYIMEKFKKSFGIKTGTRMMHIDEGNENESH